MTISFDNMPNPEPSSIVGFAQNRLVRDAENRTEETLKSALENSRTGYYLFSRGRVILSKDSETQILFPRDALEVFGPQFEKAILLGEADGAPRVAVPCRQDTDLLEEPWTSYDLRSLLYSGSVGDEDAGAIAQAASMLYWHTTNRHCGKCGSASVMQIGGFRRDCPSCGHKTFPRTDPVVIMLPIQGERCVMGRSPHFPPGWFSTLAGFVEPGETIEDAVRRETLEEAGVSVGRVKYHASQPWPFPQSLMIGLYAEVTSNEIAFDGNELEDCRWFTREEVGLMIREAHPEGFVCPPNKAISSALIRFWAED
ncbi:MAG: NAD(+) diphosphatase [Pseudomonadota bacterium]